MGKVVVPRLMWLMVDLFQRRPDFIPRPILFRFIVENVTLREGFQRVYSIILPAFHFDSWIHLSPRCIISETAVSSKTHKNDHSNTEWKHAIQYPLHTDIWQRILEILESMLMARGLLGRRPLRSVFVWPDFYNHISKTFHSINTGRLNNINK